MHVNIAIQYAAIQDNYNYFNLALQQRAFHNLCYMFPNLYTPMVVSTAFKCPKSLVFDIQMQRQKRWREHEVRRSGEQSHGGGLAKMGQSGWGVGWDDTNKASGWTEAKKQTKTG